MKTNFISLLLLLVFIETNANTNIDLSLPFNSSQGFTIQRAEYSFGFPIDSAGDVNGDGISDVVVQGSFDTVSIVYVLYGAKNLTVSYSVASTTWDLTRGFMIKDNSSEMNSLGSWVTRAGDVNGDGIDDIIVGAKTAAPKGLENAGAAYVIYGQKGGLRAHIDLSTTLNSSQGFKITGGSEGDYLGSRLSTAGDVNGDGIDDVILGSEYAHPQGRKDAGTAYVIYGQKGTTRTHIDLSTTLDLAQGFIIIGGANGDKLGFSVSNAGDVNGDGIDDVIVGANQASPNGRSRAGAAYVIYGQKDGLRAHIDLSTPLSSVQGFMIIGHAVNDKLGCSVSTAGDMNGDGIDDVIVGGYGFYSGSGAAYVVYGKKDNFTAQIDVKTGLNLTQGFEIRGNVSAGLGCSASAGDFNGDGISDVIVGAYLTDLGEMMDVGMAYVIYGKKNGLIANINTNTTLDSAQGFMIVGTDQGSYLGWISSAAGDVNGDGIEDFIVSGQTTLAYVIYSSCDIGYYFSSDGKCIECPHCNLCTITGCQDCKSGFSLYSSNGKCYATGNCPSGTYESNAKCLNCSTSNCAKCTDTECQACKNNFSLYSSNGNCYATGACPSRTYENNSKCIDCSDANCDACTNAGCETCKNGFSLYRKDGKCYATGNCPTRTYENNNKCIDCADPNCDFCTNNGCQTCKNGFSVYISNGKCYASGNCPSGTYESNAKCLDCADPNCDVCTNNGCQTCKNGFSVYISNGNCYASGNCPSGTYESNAKCLDCSTRNCAKCTDTGCQACKNGFYFYISTGKCYVTDTCPQRTYQDNGKCIDCSDYNCDICTNIGCQTCKNGYVLDSVQRTCSACPLGTYKSDNKCLDCSDPNCNKCTDIKCQSCKKGYLLDSEEGKCSSKSAALVNNSVVTVNSSAGSDSSFFTPSTVVAIALPVVEGIAIVFLAVQLIKLRTALMRRRPIRIEPLSTQVSPTPRLSTKSNNYSPTNAA